ncbi:UNVERIFIED_ORG: oligosaccharide repeat unit polymerase [Rhizobium esperanzae]
MSTSLVFAMAVTWSVAFYIWRVGINLTLSSVFLGLMLALHGPMYLYYTRIWGIQTKFFEIILSSAPYTDAIGALDLSLALSFVCITIGIAGADFAFGVNHQQILAALHSWRTQPVRIASGVAQRLKIISTIGFFIILTFIIAENKIPQIIVYFISDASEVAKIAMRRESGGSRFYLFNLLVSNLFPFSAFCCFLALRQRSMKLPAIAWAFIVAVMVAKASTLSKAPLAIFVLQLIVVEHLRKSLDLPLGIAIKFISLCVLLFGAMVLVAIRELHGVGDALDFLFYRIFMIANESLLEYYAAIPSVLPYGWGSKFSWLVGSLIGQPSQPTYVLVGAVHRGMEGSTSTAMFIADAWADFSWVGVFLFSLFAGFFIRLLDIQLIVKRGKTVATIAGLALGHYGIFVMLSTALQTAMMTGGLFLIVPLVLALSSSLKWVPDKNDGVQEHLVQLGRV